MDQAATEGLALLHGGAECIKFSRAGQPSVTLIRLSPDQQTITWQRHGLGKLKRKQDRRAVEVEAIERVDVGRESAAFRSAPPNARGSAHLSLSLVMRPSHAVDGRQTLDLCCADEESFGLLVAALRALVARRAEKAAKAAAIHRPWGAGLPVITSPSKAANVTSTLPASTSDVNPQEPPEADGGNEEAADLETAEEAPEAVEVVLLADDEEDEQTDPAEAAVAARRVAELEQRVRELEAAAADAAGSAAEPPVPAVSEANAASSVAESEPHSPYASPDRVSSAIYLSRASEDASATAADVTDTDVTDTDVTDTDAAEVHRNAEATAFDPDATGALDAGATDAANDLFRLASFTEAQSLFEGLERGVPRSLLDEAPSAAEAVGGPSTGTNAEAAAGALFGSLDEDDERDQQLAATSAHSMAACNPFEAAADESCGSAAATAAADLFGALDVSAESPGTAQQGHNPFGDTPTEGAQSGGGRAAPSGTSAASSNPFEVVGGVPQGTSVIANPFDADEGESDESLVLSDADEPSSPAVDETPELLAERLMREIDDI